ncbi:MAG: hypothetical protein Kow0010_18620 [Dehalococcoidia bacterium]
MVNPDFLVLQVLGEGLCGQDRLLGFLCVAFEVHGALSGHRSSHHSLLVDNASIKNSASEISHKGTPLAPLAASPEGADT